MNTDHFTSTVVQIVTQIHFAMLTVPDARITNVVIEHRFPVIGMSDRPQQGGGSDAFDWIERCPRLIRNRFCDALFCPGSHLGV